jgi:hypothetical protein
MLPVRGIKTFPNGSQTAVELYFYQSASVAFRGPLTPISVQLKAEEFDE